ncbi:hypothetical protein DEM27_28545 [Metarhizobium album]|uniref:Uncharacterized protein n=1 Tax=Metarhizobium album TaxID=2182425 RepID=A0A2U2DHL6_9HYPH|nr:hypothetical protein [Rhizobium album]PWE52758.1 hypothetical protein DEM27_28545 [Rhizobium album]
MTGRLIFMGEINKPVANSIHHADALSFMRRLQPIGSGIDYWAVADSGKYRLDYQMGQRLGNEYLEFVGNYPTFGNANLLGWIVEGIARTADHNGKIDASALGFLRVVNDYAMAAAAILAMPSAHDAAG